MNPNQIKIDTYKELIEWAEKQRRKGNPELETNQDFGYNQALAKIASHLKGRIEELEKDG